MNDFKSMSCSKFMYTTFITVIIDHVSINSDTTFSLLPLLAQMVNESWSDDFSILNSNNTLLVKLYSVLCLIKAFIMTQFALDHIRGHDDRIIFESVVDRLIETFESLLSFSEHRLLCGQYICFG